MKKTLTADLEVGIVLVDCDPVPVRQVPVVILKQVHDLILLQCDLQPVGMDRLCTSEQLTCTYLHKQKLLYVRQQATAFPRSYM